MGRVQVYTGTLEDYLGQSNLPSINKVYINNSLSMLDIVLHQECMMTSFCSAGPGRNYYDVVMRSCTCMGKVKSQLIYEGLRSRVV